jgi:hypothetical protein
MAAASKSFDVSLSVAITLPIGLTVELERSRSVLKPAALLLLKGGRTGLPLDGLPKQLPETRQTPDE